MLQGPQGLGDGRRGVGVIHEDAGAGGRAEALQPARHAVQGSDAPGHFFGAQAQPQGGGRGGQDVGQVEGPHQGGVDLHLPHGAGEPGLDAVGAELISQRPHLAVGVAAVGEGLGPHPAVQLMAPGVVQVEDRQAGGAAAVGQNLQKEAGLDGKVVIQVPVVIQVVLAQVGEDPDVEGGPVHPVQVQGMGGDFHADVADALSAHGPQEPLQVQGFRGGHRGRPGLLPGAVIDGADHSHRVPGAAQDGLQQVGGAGLAVGAGDAHQGQLPAGVAVKGGGEMGQGQPRLVHPDCGNPGWDLSSPVR